MDLTSIETRESLEGVTLYRGYIKANRRKIRGRWTPDPYEAIEWRLRALDNTEPSKEPILSDKGYVYFIQATSGPIKIGWSQAHPSMRRDALQTGNHEELCLTSYIRAPYAREAEIHALVADYRIRGEWFWPVPAVLDIAGLGSQGPTSGSRVVVM